MSAPIFPAWLALSGENQRLRRRRERHTSMRTWRILPRYGTGEDDRWTIEGTPAPGPDNPAAVLEDGQFARLAVAYAALDRCLMLDDGTHMEE